MPNDDRAVDNSVPIAPAAANEASEGNVATPPVPVSAPNGVNGVETQEAAPAVEPQGTRAEYKRLDEIWDQDSGNFIVKESAPPRPRQEKVDQFGQYCFNVVRRMHEVTGQPMWTMVEIKSQVLRDNCRRVIGELDGMSWGSRQLRIEPSVFFRFYYRLKERLATLQSENTDSQAVSQLKLLLEFTRAEFASKFEELEEITARGEITFELLDCILLPGTVLYTTCSATAEPRACKLVSVNLVPARYSSPAYWNINTVYVEATGTRSDEEPHFGHSSLCLRIIDFNGIVKIHALDVYPFKWHPRVQEMRKQLIARGRVWQSLDGVFHKRYDGVAYIGGRRVLVNSRVMVDRALYDNMSGDSAPEVIRRDEYYYDTYDSGSEDDNYVFRNPYTLLSQLSEDDLLMTPVLVYGFSLEDKRWLAFNVLHITVIKWNEEAFERLVLPEDQKDLIKGLVEAQATNAVKFDDFVEGKGRGLVINLFGPPGATSEHLRRPLYVVGAGDLGTTASGLDSALTGIFKVGAAWGAVVLIDEADVYLEQRSMHDLQRNALVSVFLRQLEYFAGLLFLTTNRVRTFDEAFQSRIHVSLRYRELDVEARRKVWLGFLDKLGVPKGQLSAEDEQALVAKPLNGRQIKNAVRTAGAMASSRKEPVAYRHIKGVVDIMQQFEKDFSELNVKM